MKDDILTMAPKDLALLIPKSLTTVCFAFSSPATLTSLSLPHHPQGLCTCCFLSTKSWHGLLSYTMWVLPKCLSLRDILPDHPRTAPLPLSVLSPCFIFLLSTDRLDSFVFICILSIFLNWNMHFSRADVLLQGQKYPYCE